MRSVMIMGDTHIHNHQSMGGAYENGINHRCADILRIIATYVDKHKPDVVFQLGDFFDNAKPTPAVYYAAMKLLQQTNVEWHIIAGNHDIASFGAPSAIRPLAQLPKVHVYEQPTVVHMDGTHWHLLPYCALDADTAMRKLTSANNYSGIVLAHYGLGDLSHQGPDYISEHWQDVLGQKYLYCGHEHSCYRRSHKRVNVGSLCAHSFSEAGFRPGGVIVDMNIVQYIGPVFETYGDIRRESTGFTSRYVRTGLSTLDEVKRMKATGRITDYKISVVRESKQLTSPEAAFNVASMETVVNKLIRADVDSGIISSKEAELLLRALETV